MGTVIARSRSWQHRPFVTEGRLRLTPIDHEQERTEARVRLMLLLTRRHATPKRRWKLKRRLAALGGPLELE